MVDVKIERSNNCFDACGTVNNVGKDDQARRWAGSALLWFLSRNVPENADCFPISKA
jgi:hypothetical protein